MSTFLVEAMESRVLLTCDPNFAGVNIDASMQATAHNLFTESSQFLGKVQTWIYDTALGTQLPIIGAPFKGLAAGCCCVPSCARKSA